ncbi:hypothetical protein EB837_11725 [Kluyvera ascorbata]|uniref:Uncharacterized protein n=1 Tax=Kluyvera ascorbata TaxID=51288 RepID=A0A3N2S2Z1_9ENTR|nr:hypothetical protein EB837_11725 [Kluyvera ascorbata]
MNPGSGFTCNHLIIMSLAVEIVIFIDVKIDSQSTHPITHIVNKIAMPFFYAYKFPTIANNVCQQLWGSHGHGQTQ